MFRRYIAISILACAAIALGGCVPAAMRGSGRIVSENRTAVNFSRIELVGSGDVVVTQGATEGVRIEADDNLMDYIEAEVRGDTLRLGFKNDRNPVILPSRSIQFFVDVKTVESLTITGAGNISANTLQSDRLVLDIGGSGDIRLDALTARSVKSNISGSGDCRLAGAVEDQSVEITGAGTYSAEDLESETASVEITGAGDAVVRVNGKLDVRISGAGRVRYFGDPEIQESVSGLGSIRREGD